MTEVPIMSVGFLNSSASSGSLLIRFFINSILSVELVRVLAEFVSFWELMDVGVVLLDNVEDSFMLVEGSSSLVVFMLYMLVLIEPASP